VTFSIEDARLHGGWLEAWGAPGRGAQFRLTLPARAGDRLTASPLRLVPDGIDPGPVAVDEGAVVVRQAGAPDGPDGDHAVAAGDILTAGEEPALIGHGDRGDGDG
jgi:two-component system sensor histidine kinase MtrB